MVYMPRGVLSPEKRSRRFWEKVEKTEHCWLWVGALALNGYGVVYVNNRRTYAHRFAYELEFGPIKPGTEIDHQCENKRCVRPLHLEAVSHRINMLRGRAGAVNAAKNSCPAGHEYTAENTYIYQGKRNCRTCKNDRNRAYRKRRQQD